MNGKTLACLHISLLSSSLVLLPHIIPRSMYVYFKCSMAGAEAFHRAWTSACMVKNAINDGYDIVSEPEIAFEAHEQGGARLQCNG